MFDANIEFQVNRCVFWQLHRSGNGKVDQKLEKYIFKPLRSVAQTQVDFLEFLDFVANFGSIFLTGLNFGQFSTSELLSACQTVYFGSWQCRQVQHLVDKYQKCESLNLTLGGDMFGRRIVQISTMLLLFGFARFGASTPYKTN